MRDDIRNTATLSIAVTVTDVNEPPDVTGQQSQSFAENHATGRVLATYNATDPEDPSAIITRWSLSGTDGGDFTIDEQGELRFRNGPDYERPADSGKDNVYNFSVRASDGSPLRLPAGDCDRDRCERASGHNDGQQFSDGA